ncbi:MAG: radical SAM protein [Clostridiales Family XIII bacterium]|jgi:MoaA/NifB/PqqE/SkfB family radical SAM enzyme|nr:radical SAM protein [Clostridiales Family XIII bacterium]
MANIKERAATMAKKEALGLLVKYLSGDPIKKLPAMFDLATKLDKEGLHASQIRIMREKLLTEGGPWNTFVKDLFVDVDAKLIRKLVECFFVSATIDKENTGVALEKKYNCNIPWAILMDPTSACNLTCTGCWAAQYGHKSNLSNETLDSIISQGKELGIRFYIFSGGEPLVRKNDLIRLCEKNQDCYFLSFTNGTLVDEEFCKDLLRVANFALAFSIEGTEEATDMRRGKGTYQKVIGAMHLMKKYRLIYGISTCYHKYNTDVIGSDDFIDNMVSLGNRFAWNFTYMPVGKDAVTDLLATPEQREYMYRRIREIRDTKPIFALDFWNDGEYTGGCIAGGRRYLHINSNGDVEPCAFCHYSNVNIHDVTLLQALQSPIFMEYRKNVPFSDNMLRPCPMLDNPEKIEAMVNKAGAKSTDMVAPEPIEDMTARTRTVAGDWKAKADILEAERVARKAAEAAAQESA